jgi:diguanylate cyclase (GGDEF)-like protein/PAS domain S-box-containing protein
MLVEKRLPRLLMPDKKPRLFHRSSLRTRITFGVLVILVVTLWLVTLLISRNLRTGMESAISAQQFSAVSLAAQDVDRAIRERQKAVELLASQIGRKPLTPEHAQSFLNQRMMTSLFFNWGIVVIDRQGMAIASVPPALERTGTDYSSLSVVQEVLGNGKTLITDPIIGLKTGQPVVSMIAAIREEDGKVIGVVMGVTNLSLSNFLDNVGVSKYGQTGDFFITAPRTRSYVASSDKQRLLRKGPPAGVNAVYDRYIDGYEGSGIAMSSRGVLELSSSIRIPSTGWLMQSVLPAEEAFAPIRAIQQQLLVAAMLITLAAAGGCGWWLRRELSPLAKASAQLDAMREGTLPRQALSVYQDDEIGRLTSAFNALLERIQAEEEKATEYAANERLRKIVSHIPGVVFQYRRFQDGHGCFPFASEAFEDIYGIPPEDVRENADCIRAMVHPDDYQRFFESLNTSAETQALWRVEYRVCLPDNRTKWLLVEAMPETERGVITWYGFIADITKAKNTAEELRIAATTFLTHDGIIVTNKQGIILRVNPAFTTITGYAPEEVIGQRPSILKSPRHDASFYTGLWSDLLRNGNWSGEIWNRRKSGEVFPELLTITEVRNADGEITHYVGVFQDITAHKAAENEIRHLAFFDPLTQLPNRRLLHDRLQQAMASSRRNTRHGALLFLDLDNFKTLNDSHGHDIGDQLLVEVANRLRGCVREGDSVSRLGGDEFVVLLEELSEVSTEATQQAELVATKVLAALNRPYLLNTHEYRGSSSIGITTFNGRESSAEELLKQADLAMYQAKAGGRNTLRFFDPAMQASINARSLIENELHLALENNEFVLYYQPQIDLQGRCLGVEALIRWQNPRRGFISPLEFIPLAEESGLILPIGDWVLEEACRQLSLWSKDQRTASLTIAVNVSARQFHQPGFVERVHSIVSRNDIDPSRLKLEITESLLLSDVNDAIQKMSTLRAMGIAFSLDDFGTGYSSLSYLKRLPLDQIKIDQSFVRDILTDQNDTVICRAVIALGRSLALAVIAEGVETDMQWALLKDEGCHAAQGYLFGRPMPVAELEAWLHQTS